MPKRLDVQDALKRELDATITRYIYENDMSWMDLFGALHVLALEWEWECRKRTRDDEEDDD